MKNLDTAEKSTAVKQGNESLTVFRYRLTDSTNKRAKLFAEGICDEVTAGESFCEEKSYLFVADTQSAGRGRLGRSFLSEDGGLYMSYLFRPDIKPAETVKITAYAALAVAEAIEELTGAEPLIKWVNDVYLGGKKLSGILAEGALTDSGDGFRYSIIGIGINVKQRKFEGELEAIATDIETQTGVCLDVKLLSERICEKLSLIKQGIPAGFMEKYKSRSLILGRHVTVYESGRVYTAIAADITDDGRLRVLTERGEEKFLSTADVSLKIQSSKNL